MQDEPRVSKDTGDVRQHAPGVEAAELAGRGIRGILHQVDPRELVETQWRIGRGQLDPSFVGAWRRTHRWAREILRVPDLGHEARGMADLLCRACAPLDELARGEPPTYRPYTSLDILEWFVGERTQSRESLRVKVLTGIHHLLVDLRQFEIESMADPSRHGRTRVAKEVIAARIATMERTFAALEKLRAHVPVARPDPRWVVRVYDSLEDCLLDPISTLVVFSRLPQTICHDEVVFLRTVQVAELCFLGLRAAVEGTIEALHLGLAETAVGCLQEATALGRLLHETFRVLRKMPVEHFHDFRPHTGRASAVRSFNFQQLDILLRGVDSVKSSLVETVRLQRPESVSLREALRRAPPEIVEEARSLDRILLTWRGLHLSFAKVYLMPGGGKAPFPQAPSSGLSGTGGTSGPDYLVRFLRFGLFDDLMPDGHAVEELLSEEPVAWRCSVTDPGCRMGAAR